MKFNFKTLAAFCAFSTMMTGCANDNDISNSSSSPLLSTADKTASVNTSDEESELAVPVETSCTVTFSDEKISVNGSGAVESDKTVKITDAGEADKNAEITLLLNNAELTSKNGAVIDCESAKTLTIFSKDGTKNALSDSESYTANDEADAAVFTRSDLEFKGAGELNIESKFGVPMSEETAREFHADMSVFSFGLAVLVNGNSDALSEEDIAEAFAREFFALYGLYFPDRERFWEKTE